MLVAVSVQGRRPAGTALPAPSVAEFSGRPAVQRSEVITVVGGKIIARRPTEVNGRGPLGLLLPASGGGVGTSVIAVQGSAVVAQGTDESGDGRTGTWAYAVTGSQPPVFLGQSLGFVPSMDGQASWLYTAAAVREVALSDGATLDGPYPLNGRVVAAVGGGLLLQRGPSVVWWIPGSPGQSQTIGTGTALGGLFETVLWQAADGPLTVTDPNTGRSTGTAVKLGAGERVELAALSGQVPRVAAAVGATLRIGDIRPRTRTISIHLGPIEDLAWLDYETLIVRLRGRGLALVDASSGAVVGEPNTAVDGRGLALSQPPVG